MLKKALQYGLIGLPAGVFISCAITIFISLSVGDGGYYPVKPTFAAAAGSEMKAVVIQFVLSALLGFVCGAASIIWRVERWSLLKKGLIHLPVLTVAMLPVAYICEWMPRTWVGVLLYFLLFILIYAAIWLAQYLFWKRKIQWMNEKLQHP